MAERILIVEDNQPMRRSLVRLLEGEAYVVSEAADGEEGLAQLARVTPDLIIMDINMPRMDGFRALQHLRQFSDVPVLMLSVRIAEQDKVVGFDLGADDFVPKPFGAAELLARVRALLRRRAARAGHQEVPHVVRLGGGDLVIDIGEQRVLLHGQVVHLTRLEARLLLTLAGRAGEVCKTADLCNEVWEADSSATPQNLKLYILYLRRKIEPDPAHPVYLLTVRGAGYMLAAV